MIEVLLKTLPFFAIVGLGYGAARTHFFTEVATLYLTKFVFYFALPAMIIRFSANLSFSELVNLPFIAAYLSASFVIYMLATCVAVLRQRNVAEDGAGSGALGDACVGDRSAGVWQFDCNFDRGFARWAHELWHVENCWYWLD